MAHKMKEVEMGDDDVHVRLAVPGDAEALIAILNPIIAARAYTVLDGLLTLDDEDAYISGFPERGVFVVAESVRRGLLAMQTVEPFADYTRALRHVGVVGTFVALDARRQRLGALLFSASLPLAIAQGFHKLLTYVRADNASALAFYRAQGFRIVGTARDQARIDGVFIDEVIIERALGVEGVPVDDSVGLHDVEAASRE
jgi:L-amino acid N-acyltransferase YncA